MADEALTEKHFEVAADAALHALLRALEDALDETVEIDLQSGILTLEFKDGTKYVINSHRAARQIWMAAERQAWHFDYRTADQTWVTPGKGEELWATIEGVVTRKVGRPLKLRR